MNSSRPNLCSVLAALFWIVLLASATMGQSSGGNFAVTQTVVGNGGAQSSAGSFSVTGTAGQPAAGTLIQQGSLSQIGGFWAGAAVLTPSTVAVEDIDGSFGGVITLRATLTANGADLSGKLVSFALNGSAVGTATTDADGVARLANISLGGINAGAYPAAVTVQFAGDAGFALSNGVGKLTVARIDPVLQVTGGSFIYDGQPHVAGATLTGVNGEVPGPLSLLYNGSTAVPVDAGMYLVTASFAGNQNYNPVTNNQRSIVINKANQIISFSPLTNKTFNDPDFGVSASASSGSSVSFAAAGNCSINGNSVHLSGAGSCTITAAQPGGVNYNPATSVSRTFSIGKADQTIAFAALPNKMFGDAEFAVNAMASSSLDVSLAATGQCTVNGLTVHILGAGSCTLTASQPGDANYNSSADARQSFNIAKADTTTTVTALLDSIFLGQSQTITARVDSGAGSPAGSIQFKIDGVNWGNPLTLTGGQAMTTTSSLSAGAHIFSADYSGDSNFATSSGMLSQSVENRALISLSNTNYVVNESDGSVTITVNRSGDLSVPVTVDYATDDTGSAMACSASNGLDSARCDFGLTLGTLKFVPNETQKSFVIPITQDAYTEGPETFTVNLSNLTGIGAALVNSGSATVTINDSAAATPNAIDDTETFVRQQYRDFLNRDADPSGLAFWKQNIDKCNDAAQREPGQNLAQCFELQRILTSAAFFLSIEFRETGGLIRDFYVAALDRPATSNMPNLIEFTRDTQAAQLGLVVGQGNWQQTLKQNRDAFMQDFVMRAEFVGLYPTTDTPAQYVDKLLAHAGIAPAAAVRTAAVAEFGAVTSAADPSARGRALLRITQDATFQARELNRSFAQLEYFGYLRRNPNDAPDSSFDGYAYWLNKLNQFNGDFVQAEMVKAFLRSTEYRQRFGP